MSQINRMFLWSLVFCALLIAHDPAMATGNDRGNGGLTARCRQLSSVGYEYEALDLIGKEIRLGIGPIVDPYDAAFEAIAIFAIRHPEFADRILEEFSLFRRNAQLVDVNAERVNDLDGIFLPKNCDSVVTAIWHTKNRGFFDRYEINRSVWDAMSTPHRAAVVVNAILSRALESSNPEQVREIVGALFSTPQQWGPMINPHFGFSDTQSQ